MSKLDHFTISIENELGEVPGNDTCFVFDGIEQLAVESQIEE